MSPRQTSQRQQLRVGKCSPHPSDLKPQSIPDTVSEICAARHALPSSGLLGGIAVDDISINNHISQEDCTSKDGLWGRDGRSLCPGRILSG